MKIPEVGEKFIDPERNRILEIEQVEQVDFLYYSTKMVRYIDLSKKERKSKAGFEYGSPFHQQLIPDSKLSRLLYGLENE